LALGSCRERLMRRSTYVTALVALLTACALGYLHFTLSAQSDAAGGSARPYGPRENWEVGLDGDRASLRQDRAPSNRKEEVTRAFPKVEMFDCLHTADPELLRECLLDALQPGEQGAKDVGLALCKSIGAGDRGVNAQALLLACINSWRYEPILPKLDLVRGVCPGWRIDELIVATLMTLAESDQLIFSAIVEELTPDALYDPSKTSLGITLAARLSGIADREGMTELLLEGATGAHGGTAAQVDMSILEVSTMLKSKSEELGLIRAVLDSSSLPKGAFREGLGSSLVHILLRDKPSLDAPYQSNSIPTVSMLVDILNHETLGASASMHVLQNVKDVPVWLDEPTWHQLQEQARAVATSFRLVIE
jgi:hypothetical protein